MSVWGQSMAENIALLFVILLNDFSILVNLQIVVPKEVSCPLECPFRNAKHYSLAHFNELPDQVDAFVMGQPGDVGGYLWFLLAGVKGWDKGMVTVICSEGLIAYFVGATWFREVVNWHIIQGKVIKDNQHNWNLEQLSLFPGWGSVDEEDDFWCTCNDYVESEPFLKVFHSQNKAEAKQLNYIKDFMMNWLWNLSPSVFGDEFAGSMGFSHQGCHFCENWVGHHCSKDMFPKEKLSSWLSNCHLN